MASKEAERSLRKLKRSNPSARFVLTGCAAETDRIKFGKMATVIGQGQKDQLGRILTKPVTANRAPGTEFPLFQKRNREIFNLGISRFDGHTRAFLKVEDGCDLNCSFCIIPRVRGTVSSRPVPRAVDEALQLVENGYKEIVLTGVHLGSYGKDLAGRSLLPDLIEQLLDLPGLARIRLSSLEVNEIEEPLLRLMEDNPRRFCPHLHLPLQSGDDDVLQAMRRRYSVAMFREACDRVAARVPDPAFTTDVIIGFPGETREQFENTVQLCRDTNMSRIHLFPYSPRNGTDAARRNDDVPGREKKRRLRQLQSVAAELTRTYSEKFRDRDVDVLVESRDGSGYTERYLRARVADTAPNTLITARGSHVLEACV